MKTKHENIKSSRHKSKSKVVLDGRTRMEWRELLKVLNELGVWKDGVCRPKLRWIDNRDRVIQDF